MLTLGAALIGGCSDSAGGADCSVVIRYQDAIYSQDGFTHVVDAEIGTADLAASDDTGEDAKGPYFPEKAEQVAVWSVPGRNPAAVVAIVETDNTYRVMRLAGIE